MAGAGGQDNERVAPCVSCLEPFTAIESVAASRTKVQVQFVPLFSSGENPKRNLALFWGHCVPDTGEIEAGIMRPVIQHDGFYCPLSFPRVYES